MRLWRQFALAAVLLAVVSASVVFFFVAIERKTQLVGGLSIEGFTILVLALGVLTIAVLQRLYSSIARPIEELSIQMQKLNDGNFSARVPVRSLSEIGSLQENFNRAAERVEGLIGELRKLDQMKSEFISTVSHELRTPLTSIGGYVKLISAGDAGPVTQTQYEFLSIVEANVERLTSLINDILDMERMESGKFQLVKEPQDLREVLRECRDSLLVVAQGKKLDLRVKLPESLPVVLGERSRLIQIFNNLVSNAIKYTSSGHVELEVEPRDFAVLVRVRDTGLGIAREDQDKLFQKFYRTDAGLASKEKGTGLGLAITRGLVESHGGTISVESEPGRGSVFTVSLPTSPVYQASEVAADRAKSEELVRAIREVEDLRLEQSRTEAKVLWILDPDVEDAQRLETLLHKSRPEAETQAFVTRVFRSLADVPELMEGEAAPAVVIVDPGTLAGEAHSLSELRRKLKVSVPVLVISDSVDTSAAFAEGASALITKPVHEREFWIALQDLLQNRGRRILVGDANTDFRILIKRELEQRGFEVDDVDRGKLVMGRLDHDRYDLVLIDVGFPDVSGVELLKAIRKRAQLNSVPVYLMLEFPADTPAAEDLQSSGRDIFVGKERGIDGIVSMIAQELEGENESTAG